MFGTDIVTEVWQWALPYVRNGKLTKQQVSTALASYKQGNSASSKRIIQALKALAEQPVPWYQYWPRKMKITDAEFFFLVHLWEGRTWREARQLMSKQDFLRATKFLELRGWLTVKRSASKAILDVQTTDQTPAQPTNMRKGYLDENA